MNKIEGAEYWKNRPLTDIRKDWPFKGNWIEGYSKSIEHPHRKLIIKALKKIEFKTLLEIGCGSGPNLIKISENFKNITLAGIDINKDSIDYIDNPKWDVRVGNYLCLPWNKESFDVTLADAVLMYANPDGIVATIKEIDRVTKKAVIIIDWYDESTTLGTIKDYHWARNYSALLEYHGFKVEKYKLTKEDWPRTIWEKNGYLFTAIRK